MPVTKGAGNPKWTRDETLLALDLLYAKGPLDRTHADVRHLSALLRSAKLHPLEGRKDNFRNPDGVALKLQNLLSALDVTRGLSASEGDKAAVRDYPRARAHELAVVAANIRSALDEDLPLGAADDEDAEHVEGRILTAQHRSRDRRLRAGLLAKTSDSGMTCEICGFSPPAGMDRPLRESFFEAHHVLPLAATPGVRRTKRSDLALLCACCHRYIHKLMARRREWLTIERVKAEFAPRRPIS